MADVPFVPEGHILQGRQGIGTHQAGKTGEVFRQDGISFVGHGGGALLSRGKILFRLPHLGPLEQPDLLGKFVQRRGDDGQGGKIFGMTVPLDDLRGDGRRF